MNRYTCMQGRSHRPRVGVLAAFLVSASACTPDLPPALGDPIPDAAFTVVDPTGTDWSVGDRVMLSDFEGKPVIMDFWASWCGPCRQQHEYVMGLEEKYGDAVQILGVVFEDSDENARAWLTEHGATYPTVREVDRTIVDEFWISGIPHFIMTTSDRRLSWDMLGTGDWSADSVTTRLAEMTGRDGRD
ncbi:MAG: thiol-disulfide isomerase/thioredoxin [Myxococcota bacterium]|jgi:thiol-disulfide isomerase/thioredoxin